MFTKNIDLYCAPYYLNSFFIPLHPDFDTLLVWLFILYIVPIILCIIGFKSDKLIATMIMIPNLMGIGYRLFIFFNDFLHLK